MNAPHLLAINRVQQARIVLIEHAAFDQKACDPLEDALKAGGRVSIAADDYSVPGADHDDRIFSAICRTAETLLQIDRYERRALSRRKKALRALFRQ